MAITSDPKRGEIWWVDFDPIKGHEQGGLRPALMISNDVFNASAAGLCVVIPLTSKAHHVRSFLKIDPPQGGLRTISYIICDQVRTVSKQRLGKRSGQISPQMMEEVEDRLCMLLQL